MKLCHKTPVGSLRIRKYAVTFTALFSTSGLLRSSHVGANSFRSSANRVKPQSPSSALNRWFAAKVNAHQSEYSFASMGDLTMLDVNRRIAWIPQYQSELHARVPVIRRLILMALLQVERCVLDVVAVWKEQDPPSLTSVCHHAAPFTAKRGATGGTHHG